MFLKPRDESTLEDSVIHSTTTNLPHNRFGIFFPSDGRGIATAAGGWHPVQECICVHLQALLKPEWFTPINSFLTHSGNSSTFFHLSAPMPCVLRRRKLGNVTSAMSTISHWERGKTSGRGRKMRGWFFRPSGSVVAGRSSPSTETAAAAAPTTRSDRMAGRLAGRLIATATGVPLQ